LSLWLDLLRRHVGLLDHRIKLLIDISQVILMQKSIDDIDFEKSGGLIPIIVQDANTKDILTLVHSINGNILSKIIVLYYLFDYCSIYKAIMNEADPTPISSIDFIKSKL